MKRLSPFKASEKRTQFFIVIGFIVLPVVAMIYIFIFVALKNDVDSSQRLRIPPQMLEQQQKL